LTGSCTPQSYAAHATRPQRARPPPSSSRSPWAPRGAARSPSSSAAAAALGGGDDGTADASDRRHARALARGLLLHARQVGAENNGTAPVEMVTRVVR